MAHATLELHIGRRLRTRRRLLKMSQGDVARLCGITFQQVHKYEAGIVSISATRLFALAGALGVATAYFFDGYDPAGDARRGDGPRLASAPERLGHEDR